MADDYELIDSGGGRKFERFGRVTLVRPCSQALWRPENPAAWARASASFDREEGNQWHGRSALPAEWTIETAGIRFKLSGTDFGHLGIFPEQRAQWNWIRERSARDNAALNGLQDRPIRWIVDDVHKFLRREFRRERRYDAVVLDPPTFGRGAGGETYKIERDLQETLVLVKGVLSEKPRFVLFSSHTPGLSCRVAENVLAQAFSPARVESGEMLLEGAGRPCPSGIYCRCVW